MDDFDLGALDNMDFDAAEKSAEASKSEKDKAEAIEMVSLRENANVCESGSCSI
jgi:hypothetical protein